MVAKDPCIYKLEEGKIIIDSFRGLKFPSLGFGSRSEVYKFRVGSTFYALKVFNGFREEKLENFERKLNISIDSYISPIRILYLGGKFNGYLMKYCKNKDLGARNLNLSIDKFAKDAVKLLDDTEKLSKLRYLVDDTYLTNVMYDEGIKMIDMDDYTYEEKRPIDEILRLNDNRINQVLFNIFLNSSSLANLFYSKVEFTRLMTKLNAGEISFEELFNEVCMKAYNYSSGSIENISDVGKILVKNKNN